MNRRHGKGWRDVGLRKLTQAETCAAMIDVTAPALFLRLPALQRAAQLARGREARHQRGAFRPFALL